MTLQNVLTNVGLTDKESKVYLALLELGTSPASDIAERAKLNRVTTYDILECLIERKYVLKHIKERVTLFTAVEPDYIRMDIRKKYLDFKEILPELRRLHGSTYIPRIRYYEGIEGVKKVYADTLTAKTELLNYADSKSIREYWPDYDSEYVDHRVRSRIYLRGIAPMDDLGKKLVQDNEKKHREIRLVRAGAYAFSNEINIYDDKVSIVSFGKKEVVGMIIESPEIANTQRAIFMMAWEFASVGREED